jgi:hypothetical protein
MMEFPQTSSAHAASYSKLAVSVVAKVDVLVVAVALAPAFGL